MARDNHDLKAANERLLREVEERRAAEERLRESEELHRYTLELTDQLVWTASPEGRILSVSSRFAEVTGLPRDSDPHEAWRTIIHPDDYERVQKNWQRVLGEAKPHFAEMRMRVADGSYRTFRSRAAPRFDDQGRVVRWYGSTEDVEERKQATRARQRAEELYRLATRATNDAIWDLDLVEEKIHWSDSAGEALGYSGRRLGTTSFAWWEERVHPDDRERVSESLQKAIDVGKTRWSATYRFRRANGDYATMFDRGFIVREADGTPARAVGAMTDITERERAQEEIRRMQSELIHVSRVSAMGAMASTLAHELNQPLTAVSNYVRGCRRLIERSGGEELNTARDALEAAEAAALRAGQIVRHLRELVARGSSALRPEELPKLIEDAGALAFIDAPLIGLEHQVRFDPEARWVEVDRVQIQQVLINLIRNAVQAMRDSERREIVIATRAVSPQWAEVSVSDTGGGISPEIREALFTPFRGTNAGGLGIGLSISRTIVEAHGGKISAEDGEEGGTVFRFTLPRYDR